MEKIEKGLSIRISILLLVIIVTTFTGFSQTVIDSPVFYNYEKPSKRFGFKYDFPQKVQLSVDSFFMHLNKREKDRFFYAEVCFNGDTCNININSINRLHGIKKRRGIMNATLMRSKRYFIADRLKIPFYLCWDEKYGHISLGIWGSEFEIQFVCNEHFCDIIKTVSY